MLSDPRPPGIAVARRRQRPPRAAVLLSLRLGGASQSCLSSPGCREPRLASPLTANVRFCRSITSELNSEIKRITSITKLDALRERLWVTLLPCLTRNFALTLCPNVQNPWRPGERTSSSQRTTQAIAARHLRPLELTRRTDQLRGCTSSTPRPYRCSGRCSHSFHSNTPTIENIHPRPDDVSKSGAEALRLSCAAWSYRNT